MAWGQQILQQNNYVLLCNAFSFMAVDFLGKIARRAGVWLGPPLWQTHWQIWLMVPVIRWSIVEELIDGQRQTILYCRRTSGHRHTKLMALVCFPLDCVPPNAYRPMWNSAPRCLKVDHKLDQNLVQMALLVRCKPSRVKCSFFNRINITDDQWLLCIVAVKNEKYKCLVHIFWCPMVLLWFWL